MKRKTHLLMLALVLAVSVLALGLFSAARAETASVLLEKGIYTEQTVGDLDAAIKIYQQIIDDPEANGQYAAEATYRLGTCHLKKKQQAEAVKAFRALVREHPDQEQWVAKAKLRLARLISPNPAALMPPDTIVYAEIGNPGHQVEKIVNMLKGTPLANPLAVIGGSGRPATAPGKNRSRSKGPGDILSALLNPSMLEEFKKIRGLAVGLTDLPFGRQVPMVAVLYPGESDALRGLVTAGLLMTGEPIEPIEGMQALVIGGGDVACAFDDNVIIIASPSEQLRWCVRQYKGITQEPSLATANRSFQTLTSQQARQKDALTLWGNPAVIFSAFEKQLGQSGRQRRMAQRLRAIDGIIDFENIEGAVARLIIDEKNPYVEVIVAFKDGHECLAYDLIRTPELSKAGFEAVPAEALGVVSIALGEFQEGSEQGQAAQKAVKRLTGLDIGREIFDNIEQVTFFVMPPGGSMAQSALAKRISFIAPRVGLAITSRDPQQTRQLLDTLMSIPKLFVSAQTPEESEAPEPQPGRYLLTKMRGEEVYCYVGQAGRSTVVALEGDVLEASLASVRMGNCQPCQDLESTPAS